MQSLTREIVIPRIGEGLHTVRVVQLLKQPGDRVAEDEPIYTLETDKTTVDVESPYRGTLTAWLVREHDLIQVGAPVARLTVTDETAEQPEADAPHALEPTPDSPEPAPDRPATAPHIDPRGDRVIAPRTRAYASSLGISPDELRRIPAAGTFVKPADIDAYLRTRTAAPASPGEPRGYERRPFSAQQRWLITQFKRSQQEVIAASIVSQLALAPFRAANRALLADSRSVRYVSGFQCFAYWVSRVIAEFPGFRSVVESDTHLRQYDHVDLGVAVQTDAGELVTAVVEQADTLAFDAFVTTLQARIQAAIDGKDQASERMSVVLSYMGGDSLLFGAPLVVSPAVATMFFGAPSSAAEDGRAYLSLSFDHRVLNGMEVARFIARLSELLASHAQPARAAAALPRSVTCARELRDLVRAEVAALLHVDSAAIDDRESLGVLGIDSISALKLKAVLERLLSTTLPTTLLWHHPTIDALVKFCAVKLALPLDEEGLAQRAAPGAVNVDALARELDELPPDQLAALLDEIGAPNG